MVSPQVKIFFYKNLIWLKNDYKLVHFWSRRNASVSRSTAKPADITCGWTDGRRPMWSKETKSDLLVIHWINVHSANAASKMCLPESTEEIICMFLLAPLCVDWQMFCLSFSVMFACQHVFFSFFLFFFSFWSRQLSARAPNTKKKKQTPKEVLHCSRTFHIPSTQRDQTLPSTRAKPMKRFRL